MWQGRGLSGGSQDAEGKAGGPQAGLGPAVSQRSFPACSLVRTPGKRAHFLGERRGPFPGPTFCLFLVSGDLSQGQRALTCMLCQTFPIPLHPGSERVSGRPELVACFSHKS